MSVLLLSKYIKEFSGTKLLTRESEIELHRKVKEGCKESFDLFVKSNLGLVIKIATKNLGREVELLDLIQAGNIGLLKAIWKFDSSLGYKFSTYATWWIRQSISHCVENESKTIRINKEIRKLVYDYEKLKYKVERKLEKESVTIKEVSENSGFTKLELERIESALTHTYKTTMISDIAGFENDEDYINSITSENIETPESEINVLENKQEVEKFLAILSEKERSIVAHRFGLSGLERLTLDQVGEIYGVTRERIRQIESRALSKMAKHNRRTTWKTF